MVGTAERHRELVADAAPQGPGLHESKVMGVRRLPPTNEARLRRHELQMGAIAVAARLAQREGALVDMPSNGVLHELRFGLRRRRRQRLFTSRPLASAPPRPSRHFARTFRVFGGAESNTCSQRGHEFGTPRRHGSVNGLMPCVGRCGQSGFATVSKFGHTCRECRLHGSGIEILQGVLGAKGMVRPCGDIVLSGETREFAQLTPRERESPLAVSMACGFSQRRQGSRRRRLR